MFDKEISQKSSSYKVLHELLKDKLAVTGILMLLLMSFAAIFAPILAPYPPNTQDIINRMAAPNSKHLLGTDEFGRDVLSRIIFGSRVSLLVGVASVALGMVIGVPIGILCAYCGGVADLVIMRIVDILMCFPTLVFGLMLVAALGPSLINVIITIK